MELKERELYSLSTLLDEVIRPYGVRTAVAFCMTVVGKIVSVLLILLHCIGRYSRYEQSALCRSAEVRKCR